MSSPLLTKLAKKNHRLRGKLQSFLRILSIQVVYIPGLLTYIYCKIYQFIPNTRSKEVIWILGPHLRLKMTKICKVELKAQLTYSIFPRFKIPLKRSILILVQMKMSLSLDRQKTRLQVNLCQKLLFLYQLTHNMTKDCSLIYQFST